MPAKTFDDIIKSSAPEIPEEKSDFSIYKKDDDKRLVFGWASVAIKVDGEQLEDRQKDIIDPEDLEEAAYEYVLNFRDTGEEHISSMRKKGKLVESVVLTKEKQQAMGIPEGIVPEAWWIGFKIEDDDAWERVKNGTYKMFSIEGKAKRIPVEKSVESVEKAQLKGCGVIVVQNGKILSGTRIERGGRGKICGPGGHIEAGETPEEAAKREAMEEFGITCEEMTDLGTLEDGSSAIFMCTKFSGTPKTDEKEMTEPKWRTIEELQEEELFGPFEQSLAKLKMSPAKRHSVAKTFEEVLKYNHHHGADGRFASAPGGGGSFQSRTAPTLKPAKEFDDYVKKNGLKPIYRGYSADTQDHLNEYEESIKSGKSASSGDKTSALGTGVYFADSATEAEGYMNRRKRENGDEYGRITTAALDVGAKIGDYREYEQKKFEAEADLNTKAIKTISNGGSMEDAKKIADEAMEIRRMSVPEYAASRGCDAIYDKSTGYTVVTNQKALVVKVEDVEKSDTAAKTFEEVLKFNPFHDAKGRFASSNGFASYSANPKSKAGAMAISRSAQAGHGTTFNVHRESQGENITQNYNWLNGGPGAKQLGAQGQLASQQPKKQPPAKPQPKQQPAQQQPPKPQPPQQPPKPQKQYDSKGFADSDDAPYHQLYNRKQYFQQQQLTPAQKKAADAYVDPNTEPGSLYNVAQNVNWKMVQGQPLTGQHKQVHDQMMSAMHNIGHNVTLTRYDHSGMVDSLLQSAGAGSDYTKMSISQIQKALVGKTVGENKFISTTVNDFSKAPASAQKLFKDRAVKINYKAKAGIQGLLMPIGSGGDQGELVLAPTSGKANKAPRITAIRSTGKTVYRTKTGRHYPQIEIDLEWD